jgi:hypothetical protein
MSISLECESILKDVVLYCMSIRLSHDDGRRC